MRRLAELLAEPRKPVVYRIHPDHPTDDIAATARAAGWRFVHVDTSGASTKTAVLERVRDAFGWPAWFGRNLDALVDSLRDVDDEPGTVLLWSESRRFADAEREQFDAVLDVLVARAGNGEIPGGLVTILRDSETPPGAQLADV